MTPEEIAETAWTWRTSTPDLSAMAEERLRKLDPDEVEALLRWSHESQIAHGRRNAGFGCFVLASLIIGGSMIVLATFLAGAKNGADWSMLASGSMLLVLGIAVNRSIRGWRPETESVLQVVDDPRVCDPLLRWLFASDFSLQPLIQNALLRLLPGLTEQDYGSIYPDARVSLNRILNLETTRFTPEFVLAALAALSKVGDASAVRALEDLIRRRQISESGRQIHDAAVETLGVTQQRLEKARHADMLLRPAMEMAEELLLRPAADREPAESNLLRPTDTD